MRGHAPRRVPPRLVVEVDAEREQEVGRRLLGGERFGREGERDGHARWRRRDVSYGELKAAGQGIEVEPSRQPSLRWRYALEVTCAGRFDPLTRAVDVRTRRSRDANRHARRHGRHRRRPASPPCAARIATPRSPSCTPCCCGRRGSSSAAGALAADDDLAIEAADDALMAVLGKLDDFRGASRFTTWAYKFALLEAGVKARRRAWHGREVPIDEERWPRDPRPRAVGPRAARAAGAAARDPARRRAPS